MSTYRAPYGSTFTGRYASALERTWHRHLERRCPYPVRYVGDEHSHKDFDIDLPSGTLPVEVKPRGEEFVQQATERLRETGEDHAAIVCGKPPGRWYYYESGALYYWRDGDYAKRVPLPQWPQDPVPGWRRIP